jgi:hypothetical protein
VSLLLRLRYNARAGEDSQTAFCFFEDGVVLAVTCSPSGRAAHTADTSVSSILASSLGSGKQSEDVDASRSFQEYPHEQQTAFYVFPVFCAADAVRRDLRLRSASC